MSLFILDVSLLKSRGWKATTTLEEGLRIAYELFIANMNNP